MDNEMNKTTGEISQKAAADSSSEPKPKKKKLTVVFHRQNSEKNSLKSRPATQRRPAAKTAAKPKDEGAAQKPAEKKPTRQTVQKETEVAPAPSENAAQQVTGGTDAAIKEEKAISRAEAQSPATPEKKPSEDAIPAAGQDAAEKPAASKPAARPRFVDMNKVRAADNAASRAAASRMSSRTSTGDARRPARGRVSQDRTGGARAGGGDRQGRAQGGYRPQAQGGRGTDRRFSGQGGGFGGSSRSQGRNQKPGSRGRYDRNKNSGDEMRRPQGLRVSAKELTRPTKPVKKEPEQPQIKEITLPDTLTIRELADKMKIQPSAIVKKLFLAGKVVTVNQEIDYETAADIALEYEVLADREAKVDVIGELLKDTIQDAPESLVARPPVVCVMGHVDHGKTSLLDAIRQTNVISSEAGGITQHIGASVVDINGHKITFLDTPGHEAFTAMRMRGAKSTDIAILVVAADDGVMPQTVEAINHAKAAGVEIIVAVNKIDKPGANIEKVKQELTEHEIVSEEWGGSNIFVPVSAKTGEGIKDLLEAVILVTDVLELKANPDRTIRGLVIEARLDKGRGPIASILVQNGTLHVGDFVASGAAYGKVRAMIDDKGRRIKTAGPGMPVEIQGLSDVPNAGEIVVSFATEKEAKNFAETFIAESKKDLISDTRKRMSLEDVYSQIKEGGIKELRLVIKADVQGSVEALKTSLEKLSGDEVAIKIIHGGVGTINESDVTLASVANAIIMGFNVKVDPTARVTVDQEKVDVRLYKVIYQALEDVEAAMKGMLEPVYEEMVIGHAVVRQTFKASGVGVIAGLYVTDGKITKNSKCRVSRSGELLYEGGVASLKRFKDDVKEVAAGYECGLVLENFGGMEEDDTIEAYEIVAKPRS